MFMRRILGGVVLLALVASGGAVSADTGHASPDSDHQRAQALVMDLAREAEDLVTDQQATAEQRVDRFREIFNRYFAVEAIAKWALGRYWRAATEEERLQYRRLFEDRMVVAQVGRLDDYAGEQVQVVKAMTHDNGVVTVISDVVRPGGGQPVRVSWRVGQVNEQPLILDVVVNGSSMGQTLRAEFASTIRRRGGRVAGLIEALRETTEPLRSGTSLQ